MKIRRSEVAEARAVADVWLRSRVASIPQIPPPVHSDGDVRDYFERVVLAEQEVWVAEADGVVVALLAPLRPRHPDLHPALLRTGKPTGHPSDAFDTAAIIHLADYQQ